MENKWMWRKLEAPTREIGLGELEQKKKETK